MKEDYPVFVKWSDATDWILDTVEKFPKSVRFTISGRIGNIALDVMEGIIEAIYSKNRSRILEKLNLDMEKLRIFLHDELKLSLNPRSTFLNSRRHGLPFLGFRIFPNVVRIKRENLKRVKGNLKKRKREFHGGLITEERFVMSVRSMRDQEQQPGLPPRQYTKQAKAGSALFKDGPGAPFVSRRLPCSGDILWTNNAGCRRGW